MSAEMADIEKNEKMESVALQVDEEEQKLNPDPEPEQGSQVDVKNRDPNLINQHVKVRFEEIFAEPESEVHSFDEIWRWSYKLFTLTKIWVYRVVTVVLALPLAILWGLIFACLAFCNNWCYIPGLRCCTIELFPIQKIWEVCLNTICAPTYEAIGMVFSRIKVAVQKN